MAKIKDSFVRCDHCAMQFRLPFFIGDTKTFAHAILWGNRVKCPFCARTTDCNERNMSYELEDEPDAQSDDEQGDDHALHPQAPTAGFGRAERHIRLDSRDGPS